MFYWVEKKKGEDIGGEFPLGEIHHFSLKVVLHRLDLN